VAEAPGPHELALAEPPRGELNPALVYVASLRSAASRRTMESALRTVAAELAPGVPPELVAWHRLRFAHVAALKSRLSAGRQAPTLNKLLSALRGVATAAVDLGLMTEADASWRSRVKGDRPRDDEPAGRALAAAEVASLLGACDGGTLEGARDAAVVALLFGGGLRRSEIATLHLSGFDARRGRVSVVGKGDRRRTVQLAPDAADVVRRYAERRGRAPGPLVVSFDLSGAVRGDARGPRGLSSAGVHYVLACVADRAGVGDVSPHDGRRTRITSMLEHGESVPDVRREAGHRSSATTDRYDRSNAEHAHAAGGRVPMVPGDPEGGAEPG